MDCGAEYYRRYLDGDDSGLVDMIRDYTDGLMLYLMGITGSYSLAEEMTEETFFRIAVKKPRFSGKSAFKTWLYSIGRNAAVDYLRKHRSSLPLEETDLADEHSLENSYLREEQRIALHRAMNSLAPDYRQALHLSYFEGLSNAEIADIMRKSKRQIENILYRAKAALRSVLEKEGFEYEIV
ncbi:MAG: RNA polymerase sigma factor [Ruminococcus sp.]|nr:RNA polymerase sigma factor [Ruminococcus sp.]